MPNKAIISLDSRDYFYEPLMSVIEAFLDRILLQQSYGAAIQIQAIYKIHLSTSYNSVH